MTTKRLKYNQEGCIISLLIAKRMSNDKILFLQRYANRERRIKKERGTKESLLKRFEIKIERPTMRVLMAARQVKFENTNNLW